MRARTIVMIVFALAVAGMTVFVLMAQRMMSFDEVSAEEAETRFSEVRAGFGDDEPILVIYGDGEARLREDADLSEGEVPAETLHLMLYNPPEQLMAAQMPIWFFRLKGRAWLRVSGRGDVDLKEIGLDPADLKRMGPRLLFDGQTRDGRMMMWTE